jgi:hypothetical protein
MDTSGATRTRTDWSPASRRLAAWLAAILAALAWTVAASLLAWGAAYVWLLGAVRSHVAETQDAWGFPSVYVTITPDPLPVAVVAVCVWGLGLAVIGGVCARHRRRRVA